MTRDEILKMPAGQKMRELVATSVMGWKLFEPIETIDDRIRFYWFSPETKKTVSVDAWFPEKNFSQSVDVLNKFDLWEIYKGVEAYSVTIFQSRKPVTVVTDIDLCCAICRAALLAVQSASPTHDLP